MVPAPHDISAKVLPSRNAENYLRENSPLYSMPQFDSYPYQFLSFFDMFLEIPPEETYPYSPLIDLFCDLHTLFRDSEASSEQPPVLPLFLVSHFNEDIARLVPLQPNTIPCPQPPRHRLYCKLFLDLFPFDDLLGELQRMPGYPEVDPFEDVVKMSPSMFCSSVGLTTPDEDRSDWAF
ncbi:uncharacterized protein BT62DRAFT_64895 [Guyanagaster necrorhizus]|uniref:Uncharacterized protein n=1 Tax=Guyanagaster necrorhizus TaxID=856835 RepID=A0A9P7VVE2_9AGAR|nr:uncharacterized protein BT62DRAFT_64895 [Guyanagaster necrorhizus MCA 3950]KAG7447165.1 hypothetical protein BT62DRAFT_64895 [Guyanagaster necrorhizus MCA 3950]